jgi:hypothetical protein
MDLTRLLVAIANLDHKAAVDLLSATPSLATASLARPDEFFLAERLAPALRRRHRVACRGVQLRPRNGTRPDHPGCGHPGQKSAGAEPLHAAVIGVPGSASWNPACQRDVIRYLIEAGADPSAAAAGGVTPLHRAIRNRCSAAVEALLRAGADARLPNDRGTTASGVRRRRGPSRALAWQAG